MHQRDYILRIIEQLGSVLAELRRRILGGDGAADVQDDLDDVAGQAGFDLALLRALDLETLRMLVAPTGEVEPGRCWLMAEVLYLDGLECSLRDADAVPSLLKSRALYELVRPGGGMLVGLPEATARIEEIDRLLTGGGGAAGAGRLGRPRRRAVGAR